MRLHIDRTENTIVGGVGIKDRVLKVDFKRGDKTSLEVLFHDQNGNPVAAWEWEAAHDAYLVEKAAWDIAHAVWVTESASWTTAHDAYEAAHAAWTAGDYATWSAAHAAWVIAKAAYDIDFAAFVAASNAHTAWWADYMEWENTVHQPWYWGPRLWVATQQSVSLPIHNGVTSNGDLHVRVEYGASSSVDLYVALTSTSHGTDTAVASAIATAINANSTLNAIFTASTTAAVTGLFGKPVMVVLTKDTAEENDPNLKIRQYGDVGAQSGHADSPDGITWSYGVAGDLEAVPGSPPAPDEPTFTGGAEPTVPAAPTNPGAAPAALTNEPVFTGGTEPVEPVEPVEPADLSSVSQLVFAIKSSAAPSATTYALATTWDRMDVGRYRTLLNLNSTELYDDLGGDAGIDAFAELTWNEDGSEDGWESTQTITARIENDVYKGNESTPLGLPTPEEWLIGYTAPVNAATGSKHHTQDVFTGAEVTTGGTINAYVFFEGSFTTNVEITLSTGDIDSVIAGKVRAALAANSEISALLDVTGTGNQVGLRDKLEQTLSLGLYIDFSELTADVNNLLSGIYTVITPGVTAIAATIAPPYLRVADGFLYVQEAGIWKKVALSAL